MWPFHGSAPTATSSGTTANPGGWHAYSFATTACNVGDVPINWGPGGSSNHPVIGQNFFRIADGRIEQLGQSYVKHGFCAVNENSCGTCQATPLRDARGGLRGHLQRHPQRRRRRRRQVGRDPRARQCSRSAQRPARATPCCADACRFATVSGPTPGELYIAEAQYVTNHDQPIGNARNNASWRQVGVDPADFLGQCAEWDGHGRPGDLRLAGARHRSPDHGDREPRTRTASASSATTSWPGR